MSFGTDLTSSVLILGVIIVISAVCFVYAIFSIKDEEETAPETPGNQ